VKKDKPVFIYSYKTKPNEGQIQAQRTFDRRTGELNGSLSGSARFTLPPMLYGQCLAKYACKSAVRRCWRLPFRCHGSSRERAAVQLSSFGRIYQSI
jgi:hypothetical protein